MHMDVHIFNAKGYDREYLTAANRSHGHRLTFHDACLDGMTSRWSSGATAVSARPPSRIDAETLGILSAAGVGLLALRSAGYDYVDLAAAERHGVKVMRAASRQVPAVAEHTVLLMLALNRKLHRAYGRVREGNFSLDGLLGFDLCDRTVGIIGTGEVGTAVSRILRGFGCRLLATSRSQKKECIACGVEYVSLSELLSTSDVISLHCSLTPETYHLIDAGAIARMKRGVMLVNTSRGGLIDTDAAVQALNAGQIGSLGLDVYEREGPLFFEDRSDEIITDDTFQRIISFPNVIVTGHQAWFTDSAVRGIAETTMNNVSAYGLAMGQERLGFRGPESPRGTNSEMGADLFSTAYVRPVQDCRR
jgi:D-lactate dehydrogenase